MMDIRIIENRKSARRRRVAEEISDALKASGMSRKAFAEAMGRQPSEVTKWLSGTHNFTCDLLEEISSVLGVSVSGAMMVDGYGPAQSSDCLRDSSACGFVIDLPGDVIARLRSRAADSALTFREYVTGILCEKAEENLLSARDFCGIWADGYPTADELRAARTENSMPEFL